jgi:hypothetical protein
MDTHTDTDMYLYKDIRDEYELFEYVNDVEYAGLDLENSKHVINVLSVSFFTDYTMNYIEKNNIAENLFNIIFTEYIMEHIGDAVYGLINCFRLIYETNIRYNLIIVNKILANIPKQSNKNRHLKTLMAILSNLVTNNNKYILQSCNTDSAAINNILLNTELMWQDISSMIKRELINISSNLSSSVNLDPRIFAAIIKYEYFDENIGYYNLLIVLLGYYINQAKKLDINLFKIIILECPYRLTFFISTLHSLKLEFDLPIEYFNKILNQLKTEYKEFIFNEDADNLIKDLFYLYGRLNELPNITTLELVCYLGIENLFDRIIQPTPENPIPNLEPLQICMENACSAYYNINIIIKLHNFKLSVTSKCFQNIVSHIINEENLKYVLRILILCGLVLDLDCVRYAKHHGYHIVADNDIYI